MPARGGRPSGRPSMSDVAEAAGVSQQTVSRVVNNSDAVRPQTVDKVRRAMLEVGYTPNTAARSLRSGRAGAIGLLTTDLSRTGELRTVQAILDATRRNDLDVVIDRLKPAGDSLGDYGDAMIRLAGRVDGFIVQGLELARPDGIAVPHNVPVVVAGSSRSRRFATVGCDQEGGVRAGVEHMLSLGHRTVHMLGGPADSLQAGVREGAWRRTLVDHGCEVPPVVTGDWTAASGRRAAGRLCEAGATAVMSANDEMAAGLLIGLRELGVTVPEQMSVVGFDDVLGDVVWPALTTVRQDFDGIGRALAEQLMHQLDRGVESRPPHISVPAPLVVRASTDAPPS